MDIYQQIWDADMSGNGVQPILYGQKGDEATGFVIVNEKNTRNQGHKLYPKVVIPRHKKETYTLCKLLLDNYRLDKSKVERISFEEEEETHHFLEAIVDTKPMKVVRRYLSQKTGQTYSSNRWYNYLKRLYFTPFSIGGGPTLTGFEHIVVGEQKQGTVSGYHFWYKYYLDDSTKYLYSDDIEYKGSLASKEDLAVPETSIIGFKWDAYDHDTGRNRPLFKKASGFFNGCSIEGLLAIGALRFSPHGPEEAIINGARYNLVMYRNKRHMITYFPEFLEIVDENAVGKSAKVTQAKKTTAKAKTASKSKEIPVKKLSELSVRLLAGLVNPIGEDAGKESVTLLNTLPEAVNLKGWSIEDKEGNRSKIDTTIKAGQTKIILLKKAELGNSGGILTLLDQDEDPIDMVSYSRDDASQEGFTIVF